MNSPFDGKPAILKKRRARLTKNGQKFLVSSWEWHCSSTRKRWQTGEQVQRTLDLLEAAYARKNKS